MHQFGSKAAELSFSRFGFFEARALVGRMFSSRQRKPGHALLQIGSGLNMLPDFDNLDFYFAHRGQAKHIGHDLRRELPYADNSFEGIYSEHTLEHMYPSEALLVIAEAARVLKPGGVFRVSVPNLARFIAFYNGEEVSEEFKMFDSGCEAMWNLCQNHHHRSVWDAAMLKKQMLAAGFSAATERGFREGADQRLLVDQDFRAWESLYVEGTK
ncbi:methyltransferase domain-containing protein [Sphingomonas sp. HHU CXW]|uniref:Methyltransferase domain-containing protein n=2 Tax=Sphingomonas hominis TaxID=2741495 RepID=A0ABX2JK48_9SPHN|nr:methyltransferase domain-containing protein [Sphingomonas hominis]